MKKQQGSEKAGVATGTSHIERLGQQESGMDSTAKSQKPKANESHKVSRGQTIK